MGRVMGQNVRILWIGWEPWIYPRRIFGYLWATLTLFALLKIEINLVVMWMVWCFLMRLSVNNRWLRSPSKVISSHGVTCKNIPYLSSSIGCFISVEWTSAFPNTFARAQAKPISDHIPYVVCIETPIPPYNLFRFESYWLLHPVFMDVVQCCWNLPSRATNSATSLSAKFKNLCRGLKQWSKSISKLHLLLENCNAVLSQLDGLEDCRPLSVSERNFRVIL